MSRDCCRPSNDVVVGSPGRATDAPPGHLPVSGDGEGCLEIIADRMRELPGVVAIEADFKDSTLTTSPHRSRRTS